MFIYHVFTVKHMIEIYDKILY